MTNQERIELANKVSDLSTTIYVLTKKTTKNKPLEEVACSMLNDISCMLNSIEIILREQ